MLFGSLNITALDAYARCDSWLPVSDASNTWCSPYPCRLSWPSKGWSFRRGIITGFMKVDTQSQEMSQLTKQRLDFE